jgi:hypothetical protein
MLLPKWLGEISIMSILEMFPLVYGVLSLYLSLSKHKSIKRINEAFNLSKTLNSQNI